MDVRPILLSFQTAIIAILFSNEKQYTQRLFLK